MSRRQQYIMFLVDNRAGYPQRWQATMASVPPAGWQHHLNFWNKDRTHEYDVYVWGEALELNDAQKAVIRYWHKVILRDA